jgi:hypothetical protein
MVACPTMRHRPGRKRCSSTRYALTALLTMPAMTMERFATPSLIAHATRFGKSTVKPTWIRIGFGGSRSDTRLGWPPVDRVRRLLLQAAAPLDPIDQEMPSLDAACNRLASRPLQNRTPRHEPEITRPLDQRVPTAVQRQHATINAGELISRFHLDMRKCRSRRNIGAVWLGSRASSARNRSRAC